MYYAKQYEKYVSICWLAHLYHSTMLDSEGEILLHFSVFWVVTMQKLDMTISTINVSCICAGTINNILTGKVVNISSPTDAQLQCTFLSGFTGSARCTVQYGMDPTYMNLPYSAESTETGTAGNSVSVVLRERMNSSTVYYYTMSVFSGNFIVLMWGTFRTPEYRKYIHDICMLQHVTPLFHGHNHDHLTGCSLMDLWNLPATDATILTDISFLNDSAAQYQSCDASSVGSIALVNTTLNTATVAYYTGTTAGSRACFVCDESSGYELSATITERFCQRNALWSENAILCGTGCINYYHRWGLLQSL